MNLSRNVQNEINQFMSVNVPLNALLLEPYIIKLIFLKLTIKESFLAKVRNSASSRKISSAFNRRFLLIYLC